MKTVSLELAKRMKELGWKQETFAVWSGEDEMTTTLFMGIKWKVPGTFPKIWLMAPNSDEILEVLPKAGSGINLTYGSEKVGGVYARLEEDGTITHGSTHAEALGLLWCELVERGVIKT